MLKHSPATNCNPGNGLAHMCMMEYSHMPSVTLLTKSSF